ncbi:MAG: 1-acyl-sn-glycerol-3-phosphate acyltransferase [Opitutaceae bacterium]|nr:1-acyl-sn-glycerol-3-phosphate acyltransferase [Opitutaceae bacterium]
MSPDDPGAPPRASTPGEAHPVWHYTPADDLDQSLTERLRHFPRKPEILVHFSRLAAALVIRGWLRLYHRYEVHGGEHLPRERSFVMVCNHASHLDAACLQSALPLTKLHRAFSAAAADYFFCSVPLTWFAAVIANALPFSREVHVRQSLKLCEQLLHNPGNVLILFPEGTRSTTGQLGHFKPGIGSLLAGRDILAVPCHLAGAHAAWPKGAYIARPAKLRLRIGPPRTYAHLTPGKAGALAVAADLEQAVAGLAAPTR